MAEEKALPQPPPADPGKVLNVYSKQYKGCWIYIILYNNEIFASHAIINGQMYFDYIQWTHPKKQVNYLKEDFLNTLKLALASSQATIDTLTDQANVAEQELGRTVIDAGEAAWFSAKPNIAKKVKKVIN